MCPSSGETTVFMRHLLLDTLWWMIVWYAEWNTMHWWLSGMQGISPCIPDSHPYRVTSTKCCINTVISPDDGHIFTWNMLRKEINVLRKIVHQVGFIYKSIVNY